MKIETIKVRLTFTEPLLGTANNNKEVHAEYIASKAPTQALTDEEVAALDPAIELEKSTTVFPRDPAGHPCLWDYQVRGFFKEALGQLILFGDIDGDQCTFNGRTEAVDHRLYIKPRCSALQHEGKVELFTRPLRAVTAQGPRVCLATSEQLPAGTRIEFALSLITSLPTKGKKKVNHFTLDDVRGALNYGALNGLGQWRSGGFGRFTWEELA